MKKLHAPFVSVLLMASTSAPGLAWETTLNLDAPEPTTEYLFPHQLDDGFTILLPDPIHEPLPEPPPAPVECKKKGVFEKVASRCEQWAEDHPVAWRRTKNIACGFLFLVNLSGAVGNTIRWSW